MKTKRRQELKSNDLAAWLEEAGKSFTRWSSYLIAGLAVILLAVLINIYMKNARADARAVAFDDLRKAVGLRVGETSKTPEELRASLAKIDELVSAQDDADFRREALLGKATMALRLARQGIVGTADGRDPGDPKAYLTEARETFSRICADYKDATLQYGRALYGLFQIEALEFVLDEDMSHKEAAERHLNELRDDQRFNATPLQTVAIEQLNKLDRMFTIVQFKPKPTPPPTPAPLPLGVAPAPDADSTDNGAMGAGTDDAGTTDSGNADDSANADDGASDTSADDESTDGPE